MPLRNPRKARLSLESLESRNLQSGIGGSDFSTFVLLPNPPVITAGVSTGGADSGGQGNTGRTL